ncbi:MAG: hypothetical protein H7X88_12925 [Gloeobacteraceae cyanobacterium ES-bin-316]|nr:hypothetical protein [Ferruginibacter sp.]
MKTIIISLAFMATLALKHGDKLTGRWQTQPSIKGNVTGIVFKADNSFEGYINKKPFTSGHYILKDSLFHFSDNGCNAVKAIYKVIFFSESDSLRLEVVNDSCTERKNGISRLVFGRVKTT